MLRTVVINLCYLIQSPGYPYDSDVVVISVLQIRHQRYKILKCAQGLTELAANQLELTFIRLQSLWSLLSYYTATLV